MRAPHLPLEPRVSAKVVRAEHVAKAVHRKVIVCAVTPALAGRAALGRVDRADVVVHVAQRPALRHVAVLPLHVGIHGEAPHGIAARALHNARAHTGSASGRARVQRVRTSLLTAKGLGGSNGAGEREARTDSGIRQ